VISNGMLREPSPSSGRTLVPKKDRARQLAEWTRLDMRSLNVLYTNLRRRVPALPAYNVAVTDSVSDEDAVSEPFRSTLALCRAAASVGALDELCVEIIGVEQGIDGRPAAEVELLLVSINFVSGSGEPQGITSRARGKAHPYILYKLIKIFQATAYIQDIAGIVGTGFLVEKDVLLTAGHVALECSKDECGNVVYSSKTRPGLHIVFPETIGGAQSADLDKTTPLLAFAEPYTNSSGRLIKLVTSDAACKLDFALLLLDRTIVGAEPLSIEGLPDPTIGSLSFVIGYPGGTSAAMDADSFVRHERSGHRLIHMMNAQPGMSGSCCTGDGGIPVGIHEGELPVAGVGGTKKTENRAVLLRAITQNLQARDPNPLHRRRNTPGVALIDPRLVQRLGKRGQQLADEATRARWEDLFTATIGVSPSEEAGTWPVHPWFARDKERRRLQAWFRAAANPGAGERILFISGPDGSGKTFSVEILSALLANPARDLFRIEGISGSRSLDQLADQLAMSSIAGTATRTADGHLKYDAIETIVDTLAKVGGRDRASDSAAHPLFLAIDAGDEADSIIGGTEWVQLVVAAAAQAWARVVICGLSLETEHRFVDALKANQSTKLLDPDTVVLKHVTADDIAAFLDAYGRLDGKPFTEACELARSFDDLNLLHTCWEPLTTAEAALMSIWLLKRTALSGAEFDRRGSA
jgi:hypothetical protein